MATTSRACSGRFRRSAPSRASLPRLQLAGVGGAQVPHSPKDYFERHPFIDVAVRGEGEEAFTEILEYLLDGRSLDGLAGVSWRTPEGEFRYNTVERPFNRDLDIYPSPYVTGLFDGLVAERDDLDFQAIIETNRGCPFLCTFCYWGKGNLTEFGKTTIINPSRSAQTGAMMNGIVVESHALVGKVIRNATMRTGLEAR